MFRTFITIATLWCFPVLGQAQTTLAWRFEPGASFRVEHHVVQTLSLEIKNKPFRQTNIMDLRSRWQVRDVHDGVASVVVAIVSMESTTVPSYGKASVAAKDDELWKGAVFVVQADVHGRIRALAGYDEFLARLARGDKSRLNVLHGLKPVEWFRELLQAALGPLPDKPVALGQRWSHDHRETVHPIGAFEHATEFEYAGAKGHLHRVGATTRTTFKPLPPAAALELFRVVKGEIRSDGTSGAFVFDAAAGRLRSAERHGKLRGKLTLEVQNVAQTVSFEGENHLSVRVHPDTALEWVRVSEDRRGFVLASSKKRFVPWGFNYDHDDAGRLIEDYWDKEWAAVEGDFREMKELGANVVRVHLQLAKFVEAPDTPNRDNLRRLGKLLKLAEDVGLYLDITGLGCYHKADVPPSYDKLSEADRWTTQAFFWEEVAKVCAASPAVFCYDLMNEPVVPGGKRKPGDWLGPPFGGKHFVQFITLDQAGRPRPDVAREWIAGLVAAIRKHDKKHLVTIGLVDWSLDRKGLTSGFVPGKIADELDFLCVHIYPQAGKVDEALETLKGFNVGKPVVLEETFPLRSSMKEFARFIDESRPHAAGWIGFYWGKPPAELRKSNRFADAVLLQWLEFFRKHGPPEISAPL
jgi:hypothetical protein